MKHCASEACPFLRRHGRPAAFQDEVARCLDCGEPLAPGRAPEPEPPRDPGEREPMAIAASYRDVPSAYIAKGRLETEGLPSRVVDEHTVGIVWYWSQAIGGVKVEVAARDLSRARQILAEDRSSAVEAPAQEADPADRCPRCGSTSIRSSALQRRAAALSLLVGLPLTLWSRRMRCTACGFRWRLRRRRGLPPGP